MVFAWAHCFFSDAFHRNETFEVAMNAIRLFPALFRILPLALVIWLASPCPPNAANSDRLPDRIQGYLVVTAPDNGPVVHDAPPPGLTIKRFEAILVNEIYQDAVANKTWVNAGTTWTLELTLIPGKSAQSALSVAFVIDDAAKRCRLVKISDKGQPLPARELLGLYDLILAEFKGPSGK